MTFVKKVLSSTYLKSTYYFKTSDGTWKMQSYVAVLKIFE